MEKAEVLDDWCMLPFDEHTLEIDELEDWEESKKAMAFENEFIIKCECLKKKFDKIEGDGTFALDIEKVQNGDIKISENGVEILKKLGFSFSFSQIKKNA